MKVDYYINYYKLRTYLNLIISQFKNKTFLIYNYMKNNILQKKLEDLLRDRFSISESTRANYARGEDAFDPVLSSEGTGDF